MTARFGALIFDDPQMLDRGWACAGEGRARRLGRDGIAELDTGTTWITNLDFTGIFHAGLSDNCRFRTDTYLRERLASLCTELGRTEPEDQAEFASMLFSRTMKASAMLFGKPSFNPERALKHGCREYLGTGEDIVPSQQAKFLKEAMRSNANCITFRREGKTLRLRVPQRRHCLDVLSVPVPRGEMKKVPKTAFPPQDADGVTKQRWYSKLTDGGTKPGLFSVTCRNFRPEFNAFINFGDGGRRPDKSLCDERQWVTGPELVSLLVFSNVHVHEAWLGERSDRLDRACRFVESIPEWTVLSMTMNLIFDNIWTGMAARRTGLPPVAPAGKEAINAAGPFLRAQDLQQLFGKAWSISRSGAGLAVRGYASGCIRIAEQDADPADVWNVCIEEKLLPPFLHLPKEELPDPFHECGGMDEFFQTVRERPDLALKTVQILRATDSFEMLAALDSFTLKKLKALFAGNPAEQGRAGRGKA